MNESFNKCWKSYMGQVSMPIGANEWKEVICGQKDFTKKKNLIAKCTMKPFSPEEESVYSNNVAVSAAVSIVTDFVFIVHSIQYNFHLFPSSSSYFLFSFV